MTDIHRARGIEKADPVFNYASPELVVLWDRIQRAQAEFGYRQEISALYGEEAWLRARSVVDVGTGNGWWLSRIAARFPEKKYAGFDLASELIDRARARHGARISRLLCCSHHAASELFGEKFDFLTARLFLQHVPDVDDTLTSFARLVIPGGAALLVDSYDEARVFWRELPLLRKFFTEYRQSQVQSNRDRGIMQRLPRVLASRADWRMKSLARVIVPSSAGDNLAYYQDYYYLMMQIVEFTGVLRFEFEAMKREWLSWCRDTTAYTHLALDVMILERTGEGRA
jgi:ubiquinone/menaquinone biosynthesis C-methylase UbiE